MPFHVNTVQDATYVFDEAERDILDVAFADAPITGDNLQARQLDDIPAQGFELAYAGLIFGVYVPASQE